MTAWLLSGLTCLAVVVLYLCIARAGHRLPAAVSPVVVTALVIGVVLVVAGVPLARFDALSAPLRAVLGPAIVALGATVHASRAALARARAALVVAVVVGAGAGVASSLALAQVLGLAPLLTAATLTRTVSTPFAILVQARVGGPVSLAAGIAVVTGAIGATLVPPLLARLRLGGAATVGTATGVAAHIVGTVAVGRRDATARSFASAGMVGAGVVVAIVVPPLWHALIG